MRSWLLILLIALLSLSQAGSAHAQSKPSSVLDFELWFGEWLEGRAAFEAVLDPAGDLPQRTKQEKSTDIKTRLQRAFCGKEDKLLVFSSKSSMRDDALTLLKELGFPFTREEFVAFLPRADEIEGVHLDHLQSSEVAAFAGSYWSKPCSDHILTQLKDRRVVGRPECFFALSHLSLQATDGKLRSDIEPLIQSAFFDDQLSETELTRLYRILAHRRWTPDTKDGNDGASNAIHQIADGVRQKLAMQLMELPIGDFLPVSDSTPVQDSAPKEEQLTAEEFLALAGRVNDWTGWSKQHKTERWPVAGWEGWTLKLALQAKQPEGRNPRVGQFLAKVVAQAGRHYRLFDQNGAAPDNGMVSGDLDVEFFVWLHGTNESLRAWDAMSRNDANLQKTVALLQRFLDPRLEARWPVALLDLLKANYYRRDPTGFLASLQKIVRGDRVPPTNMVRRRLLQWVHDGQFPEWNDRWVLAVDAADHTKLLDPIRLEAGTCSALELLTTVCLQQTLTNKGSAEDLAQVNATYGQLLLRVHAALFSIPPEAALDGEDGKHIMEQLGLVFSRLQEVRRAFNWRPNQLKGVNGFYDKVRDTFKQAVRDHNRPQMTVALVLLLRIAGLLGDHSQVEDLARSVAGELFNVRKDAGRRIISPEVARRDAELFQQIAPAIVAAVDAVGREAEFSSAEKAAKLNDLVRLFEDHLYLPLLRSTFFLDAVSASAGPKGRPWIRLGELYDTEAEQKAAWRRLVDELTRTPFLSSHRGTVSLLGELGKQERLDLHVWFEPLPLGGNVTVPVLKKLLDQQSGDMLDGKARIGEIVELILSHHETNPLWLLEASYPLGELAPVKALDPRSLLEWHEGMVTLYESRKAPYEEGNVEAELIHRYDATRGPRYELPRGRYTRTAIPGGLRLKLIDRMNELAERTGAPLDWRLDVSRLALLLPNREKHLAGDEKLATYNERKLQLIAKWESVLKAAASSGWAPRTDLPLDELKTAILLFLVRLRYSFSPFRPEPATSATAFARQRLRKDAGRQDDYRALIREEAFLRFINHSSQSGVASDLEAQAQTLLEYARSASTATDVSTAASEANATGTLDRLQHAAAYSRQLFTRLEDSDLVLFAPLLHILESDARAEDRVSAKTSYDILVATALLLPWYGVSSEQFILPAQIDEGAELAPQPGSFDGEALIRRLIFFSLLSGQVRERLVDHAINPEELEDPLDVFILRRLLIDANTIGTLLAGQVFRNRALLKEVHRNRELSYETLNFEILYRHYQSVTVNARDLLDSAVRGCELNFKLLEQTPDQELTDEQVLDFLVPVVQEGDENGVMGDSIAAQMRRRSRRRAFRPLDDVLRTLVTVYHDDRYKNDRDELVRQAAETFQESAGHFVNQPNHALIWFQGDVNGFQSAKTYFRAVDAVLRNMDARPLAIVVPTALKPEGDETTASLRDASKDYEKLWASLLFGSADAEEVAWQRPFVDRFCEAGMVAEEMAAEENTPEAVATSQADEEGTAKDARPPLAQGLKQQRALFLQLVQGEPPQDPPAGRPLDGIARNLARLNRLGEGDRGQFIRRRYWECSRSVIRAALIGKGATLPDPVFPARPFVSAESRKIQPINESQFVDALKSSDEGLLFDALEFPRRFRAMCAERQLAELVGPAFSEFTTREHQPGLGKPSGAVQGEPLGYEHAVWASFTQYVHIETSPEFQQLINSHKRLESDKPLAERVLSAHRSARADLEAMSSAIAFRVRHNQRIECLAERAKAVREESVADTSAAGYYKWFQIDGDTVRWITDNADLPFLTAVWAPYERYAFGEGSDTLAQVNEPAVLEMSPVNWTRDSLNPRQVRFSVVYLLSRQTVHRHAGEQRFGITKSTLADFQAAAGAYGDFVDSDCVCGGSQREAIGARPAIPDPQRAAEVFREWSGLEFWDELGAKGKHREPIALPGLDYRFERIQPGASFALESKLHPLPKAALSEVSPALDTAPACKNLPYRQKMQLIVDAAQICPDIVDTPADESAIVAFLDAACRLDPVASPFQPEVRRGGVEFFALGDSFKSWGSTQGEGQKKADESSPPVEILMPRMMLLQWRWADSGMRIHEATHTELIHRLTEISSDPKPQSEP